MMQLPVGCLNSIPGPQKGRRRLRVRTRKVPEDGPAGAVQLAVQLAVPVRGTFQRSVGTGSLSLRPTT